MNKDIKQVLTLDLTVENGKLVSAVRIPQRARCMGKKVNQKTLQLDMVLRVSSPNLRCTSRFLQNLGIAVNSEKRTPTQAKRNKGTAHVYGHLKIADVNNLSACSPAEIKNTEAHLFGLKPIYKAVQSRHPQGAALTTEYPLTKTELLSVESFLCLFANLYQCSCNEDSKDIQKTQEQEGE